ncbi:thioredoxin superfamily protein [Actinidia rufa]|uniref:Thioredoxin superfamily protein n=1 Tax=Actinidia rufa TaxID=165716 RepID=A0A7J0HFE1_9ERIC|nr:thioredoxin superfamily protein [Actinidia rufa]
MVTMQYKAVPSSRPCFRMQRFVIVQLFNAMVQITINLMMKARALLHVPHIKTLLVDFGANPAVHNLDEIPRGREIEQALMSRGLNPAVPAVFISGELVGGANEVMSLHLRRSLIPMLKSAGALWV